MAEIYYALQRLYANAHLIPQREYQELEVELVRMVLRRY